MPRNHDVRTLVPNLEHCHCPDQHFLRSGLYVAHPAEVFLKVRLCPRWHKNKRSKAPMADNTYSKGTRVWFADREQGWISAEVTQVTKGENDVIKLVFVDERGKVSVL